MLDDFLPGYDVHEIHRLSSTASPGDLMTAVRALTAREVPVLVALMALRSLPALGRRGFLTGTGTILDAFLGRGFVSLHDGPDELAFGAVGRFWQRAGGVRRIEPADFRDFAEPGWAKTAVDFRVERRYGRSVLTTETRVLATDGQARRRFLRYWRVIRPGSAAIRVAWLRAIRRRAER